MLQYIAALSQQQGAASIGQTGQGSSSSPSPAHGPPAVSPARGRFGLRERIVGQPEVNRTSCTAVVQAHGSGGLPDLWMEATRRLRGWRFRTFAVKIEPILPPVHRPRFPKSLDAFGVRNAESQERKEYGTNADVGLRALSNVPAPRTP